VSPGRGLPAAPRGQPRRRVEAVDPRDPRRGARRWGPGIPESIARTTSSALVTVRAGDRRGAGFIVDSRGYIVTSRRLVAGPGPVRVTLHDGRTIPVTVVSRDPSADVAVLRVSAAGLTAARLGTSSGLRVGDPLLALGPSRASGPVRTAATLSRMGSGGGEPLALDVPLAAGAGGGPLLNARGEVVGVVSETRGGRAPATAIPIDRIKPILRDLGSPPPTAERALPLASLAPSDR
jgi:S1-C subfamily serine protease